MLEMTAFRLKAKEHGMRGGLRRLMLAARIRVLLWRVLMSMESYGQSFLIAPTDDLEDLFH